MRESGIRRRTEGIFEVASWGGARPPVIALHGFLGEPWLWTEVLSGAADLGTVVTGRLPGHGADPWKPRSSSFGGIVAEMLLSLPPLPPAWLAGYSMGARLALGMLLAAPQRFLGALLIGVHPGLRDAAERAARVTSDDAQASAIETGGLEAFVSGWEAMPLFASQSRLPPDVRARQRATRRAHVPEAVAASIRTCGLGRMPSFWSDLARCDRRLVLVTGALDEKFGALAEEVVGIAPRAEHTRVAAVGHNVALEDPATVRGLLRWCLTIDR